MTKRRALLGLLIGLALAVAGCNGSERSERATAFRPPDTLGEDPELRLGRRIYARYCAACHGVSGGGEIGPPFTDGRLLRDFPDAGAQEEFVRKGRSVMPGFGTQLDDHEIRAVVRYEREVLSVRRAR